MKKLKLLWQFFFFGTYGMISLSNLLICLVSGIFLAIPYRIEDAFDSVSNILLFYPAASFIRNIHYWSAQFVLIFTVLHIWQHFKENSEHKLKTGVWVRLSFSVLILFYLMISGFILKGDADSQQAQRILKNLLNMIPFFSKGITDFLTGKENNLNFIYLHHIATGSIILLIIVFEHARTIWGKLDVFIFSLVYVIIFSVFFTAPLHNGNNPVLKGPWYFTGFQELLHYMPDPIWAILIVLVFWILLLLMPFLRNKFNKSAKRLIIALFSAYVVLTITGFYFRGENWQLTFPWKKNYFRQIYFPSVELTNPFKNTDFTYEQMNGKKESCLICHGKMEGLTPAHQPEAIGCASCHLGNIFSMRKKSSHQGMIKIPGNLESASLSCGTTNCHPDISGRINSNLMTTISGIISVDRFAFGESENPSILSHIAQIKNSPADIHLKNLCTQCHLGRSKTFYGPIDENFRGGGCLACHLNYSAENKKELFAYFNKTKLDEGVLPRQHPSLDLKVGNSKCFSCHSRSGRISLSYEGWYETELNLQQARSGQYRILKDQRVLKFEQADIHYEKGLECIDCHTSYELMGDGFFHIHKEEQVQISCSDCHTNPPFTTISASKSDRETAMIASLRSFEHKQYLIIKATGKPLLNTFTNHNDSAFLITKNRKTIHYIKPPSSSCKTNAHKNLSCESCHTPRVARCIGCHNQFFPQESGINNLNGKKTRGQWMEYAGEFVTDAPTLGVSTESKTKKIVPLMPGMIMTISHQAVKDTFFRRLYAPAHPHNTIKPALNCINCHLNPVILGYGKGELIFTKNNNFLQLEFLPYYLNNFHDKLPADALIPFRKPVASSLITRNQIRPFNVDEQDRILLVGSCLSCHNEKSEVMRESLKNFEALLAKRSDKCLRLKGAEN